MELGKFTGMNDEDEPINAKKPPLAPKRRKQRQVVPVFYIDHGYCNLRERAKLSPEWDARMTDVD